MKSKLLTVVAIAAIGASVWSYPANALTYHFSFTNALLNQSGVVEGFIRGLTDNATSAATSVEVTSNGDGYGVGEYIGNPSANSFTVAAGAIEAINFRSDGALNSAPDVTCCVLFISAPNRAVLWGTPSPQQALLRFVNTPLELTVVSETPLPAALPLFATGLGALGLLGWRRKRKAAALAA